MLVVFFLFFFFWGLNYSTRNKNKNLIHHHYITIHKSKKTFGCNSMSAIFDWRSYNKLCSPYPKWYIPTNAYNARKKEKNMYISFDMLDTSILPWIDNFPFTTFSLFSFRLFGQFFNDFQLVCFLWIQSTLPISHFLFLALFI